VDPGEFDHAIFGNVMQTSSDALYGAAARGLKAGLKVETPAGDGESFVRFGN